MSGRVEVKLDREKEINEIYFGNENFKTIIEPELDQWNTVYDHTAAPSGQAWGPDLLHTTNMNGEHVCKTLFGEGARVNEDWTCSTPKCQESPGIFDDSKCGRSEARVWGFECVYPDLGYDDWNLKVWEGINGFNYPHGCNFKGPYKGCTGLGCELDVPYGFMNAPEAEFREHYSLACRCRDGFSLVVNKKQGICERTTFPTTSTPVDTKDLSNLAKHGDISIRLVSGEGACLDAMSGRVEVKFNNISKIDGFNGILEVDENEWQTINDLNFGSSDSMNICKAFFGYGSVVKNVLYESQCGTSQSRNIQFSCNSTPFYNGSFHTFYDYNYPTHENIYPNGCEIVNIYAGCTEHGCELREPEGFGFTDPYSEHAALNCACAVGFNFEFDVNFDQFMCVRIDVVPTVEPIVILREVETSAGKLRLISGGGLCDGGGLTDLMAGRVEFKPLSDYDLTSYFDRLGIDLNIQEVQQDMWFSIQDFDDNSGDHVCRTFYGQFSQKENVLRSTSCESSEARVFRFICDSETNSENEFHYSRGALNGGSAECRTT